MSWTHIKFSHKPVAEPTRPGHLTVNQALEQLGAARTVDELRAAKLMIERHRDAGTLLGLYAPSRPGEVVVQRRAEPIDLARIYDRYEAHLARLTRATPA